ncbi:MAG TPA: ABC transporter permease [Flavisolibacter sp.]|nr:ABC transporter permease [Flavisolibacter sp.]
MKNFLSTHNRALKAEWLKLHHSGMLWFCLAAAAFIPAFHTFVSFFESVGDLSPESGNKMIKMDFEIFTNFFFPVFLVIVMVRLVYMEHRFDTWKLIETQPVSKAAIYFSKWEIAAIISFCCLLTLLVVAFLGGLILQYGRPALGFDQSNVDWGYALQALTRFWIASLCIISIQYCLTVLVKSFALPLSIGLVAIFAGSFAQALGYMNWWPYSATQITSDTYGGAPNGDFLLSHEKISLISSLLFIWLGYQLYRRRSIKKAFLSPIKNLAVAVAVIAVFAFAISVVNKPVILERYNATVIAGEIKSSTPVTQVLLLRSPMMDTILTIPVTTDRFHISTDKEIALGIYLVKAGSQVSRVFMGSKDSIYLSISFNEESPVVKVSGTRAAENDYLVNGKRMDMEILSRHADNVNPSDYADDLIEYHNDGIRMLETFKTSDRIKPANDFIRLRKKLFATQALALADGFYPKVYASYFPNQELEFPEEINSLRASVSINSPELISFPQYRRYVTSVLREKSGNNDSLYFAMMKDSLQDPYTRDVIMYEAALSSVIKIKDSILRNKMMAGILLNMQTQTAKTKLAEANGRANSLHSGKPAFDFTAEALNGKQIKKFDFVSKYVVVEFRLGGCEPCKKESIFFKSLADRYTSPQLAFVSLSLDEDKKSWHKEANLTKENKVMQLFSKDDRKWISEAYGLTKISKFVMIDPKGNIINPQLPNPSEPEFEMILQKEIPLQRFNDN